MEKKPRKKPSITTKTTAFSGETRITPKSKKEIIVILCYLKKGD